MPPKSASDAKEQRHIQSIDVGFRLIRALEQGGAKMTLKAVAEAAQMPAAKAHIYMVSFTKLGLVVQDKDTQRYSLGPYAIRLGLSAIQHMDIVEVAREPMQTLQDQLLLPVFLSVWGNFGPTIVFKLDRNTVLPVTMKIGYVLPLLATATGNLFLTYLPDAETTEPLLRETAGQGASTQQDAIRASVRRHGLATSAGQLNRGFSSVSCGVFDHEDNLIAAVTTLGFSHQIDISPTGPVAALLRPTADLISQAIGSRKQAAPIEKPQERDRR